MESHNRPFERLVQRIDPRNKLLRTGGLKGGVSAQVTALEIERSDGQTRKMIVRRHGKADLKQNPHIAADEFKLLQILRSAGLAAPRPYYWDLCAALRPVSKIAEWAEDALREKRMRDGHRLFITQAFDKLAG
jgi:hypothetical protein